MDDPLAPVVNIMKLYGARCSAEEFHAAVNVTFHKFEAEHYDEMHQDMWQSLPRQVCLLADDYLANCSAPESLNLLDIGCGTGLATDSFLRTPLGQRVCTVDLLDTSPAMLELAKHRAVGWGRPVDAHLGLLDTLPDRGKRYDAIITCSVLHHVPDLQAFLRHVRNLQKPQGFFLHLQDPNGDHVQDPQLKQRMEMVADKTPAWLRRITPRRLFSRLYRELKGTQGQDCVSRTNRELLGEGIITRPLTTHHLFSITDIHVHTGGGISLRQMHNWLPDYALTSERSYGFFGRLWSDLPIALRAQEDSLIASGAKNGLFVSALWQLQPGAFPRQPAA